MTDAALPSSYSPAEINRSANQMARSDFRAFAPRALRELHPGADINWAHAAMAHLGETIVDGEVRFAMVNLPPRTFKSQIFSVLLPAYILGHNPKAKIICVSYGRDLAESLAVDTLKLMDTPWYRRLFPAVTLAKRAVGHLRTTQGGQRIATSIQGGVTGMGGDYIIVDDPLRADDAGSEAIRASTNDWIASTLFSRLDDPKSGAMIIVAQRLHQDDPVGRLLSQSDQWHVLSIPAQAAQDATYEVGFNARHVMRARDLMHPARLGEVELKQLRFNLGDRRFQAQYQQEPVPADGAYFKDKWLLREADALVPRPGDRIIQSWDVAGKAGADNDYSVCVTAIQRRSQIIVIDVLRERLAFPDLLNAVVTQAQRHKPHKILIEDASAGIQLIQMLRNDQPRGVPLPIAMKPIQSKQDRALIAVTRAERGELILPTTAPWAEIFVNELLAFPVGRYDDQVDALAYLMAHTDAEPAPPRLDVSSLTRPSTFLPAGSASDPDIRDYGPAPFWGP